MVDPEKVTGLIENLRKYVLQLEELRNFPREEFLKDFSKINSAKYLFQIAIECCLDMGNHLISSEGFRAPSDYKDIFKVLNENKVIPEDFLDTAISMAKFRNRLVHLYWEVDSEKVYSYLQENLKHFDRFVQHLIAYMKK